MDASYDACTLLAGTKGEESTDMSSVIFDFGTPEVAFRTRRAGGKGMDDYTTPGLSTGKKLRYNMSLCSPGSALRKPFCDVTNTSMQTPGSSSTNTRDSILLSTVHQGKQQQSPVCGLNRTSSDENLLRVIEDLTRTPPDTAAEYCVSPSYAAISAKAQQRSSGNGEKKCSLYTRILQEAAYTLPRTPNLPHRARVSHTPGMGVLRVCSEANEELDLPLATHVPPSASTTPKQQHTHSEPPTYDVETGQHSSALGSARSRRSQAELKQLYEEQQQKKKKNVLNESGDESGDTLNTSSSTSSTSSPSSPPADTEERELQCHPLETDCKSPAEVCHARAESQLYLPAMPAKGSLEEGGGGGKIGCSSDSSESSERSEREKRLYLPAEALLEGWGGGGGVGCSANSERSESERRGAGAPEEVRTFFDLIDAAENSGAAAEQEKARLEEQLVRSERARARLAEDLVRERLLRAEMQDKLLKGVEGFLDLDLPNVASIASTTGKAEGAVGGGAGDASLLQALGGGGLGLAQEKELTILRNQVEMQDELIDVLCKKIPAKDVLESTLRTRNIRDVPCVMHSIIEESPAAASYSTSTSSSFSSFSPSCPPNALDAMAPSAALPSSQAERQCGDSSEWDADDAYGYMPRSLQSSLLLSDRAAARAAASARQRHRAPGSTSGSEAQGDREGGQAAGCEKDSAVSAAALIRVEVAASSEAYEHEHEVVGVRQAHSFRSGSLSPDVSTLATVVRLTQQVRTLRERQEEAVHAAALCSSLSSRCSKLERENSTLSASFQRLANCLEVSLAEEEDADTPPPPAISRLARLVEEARMELEEQQQDHHTLNDSKDSRAPGSPASSDMDPQNQIADKSAEQCEDEWDGTFDVMQGEATTMGFDDTTLIFSRAASKPRLLRSPGCGSGSESERGRRSESEDVLYQSWYEPEEVGGDDTDVSLAHTRALTASLSTSLRMTEIGRVSHELRLASLVRPRRSQPPLRHSAWQVQEVSSASSTCSNASRHVAHGEEASTAAEASSPPRASVWGVTAGVLYLAGRGVWVIMCLGLHLLSLTILAAGLFIVVRQRQLVAVV